MATPNVITYAYIRGRWYAFPDSASAYDGVAKYGGNAQSLRYSKPVGAIIDDKTLINRGFWPDTLVDAPNVTGDALVNPPYNPIFRTPTNVPVEVTTDVATVAPSGNGGGPEPGSPSPSPPPDPVAYYNFAQYVQDNPDLRQAYLNYVKNENPEKIDSWEIHGKELGISDLGADHYSGSTMVADKWGETHWKKYGKDEDRDKPAYRFPADW